MKNNVICLLDGGYHYLLTYAHQDWLEKQLEKVKKDLENENITDTDRFNSYVNPDDDFTYDDIPF
tara:strand:+ start:332 stop:526 length:195 start_codon:yes stop_codon:yes gene_type:complete